MSQAPTQHPTNDELTQFAISKFQGIDVGLGKADPMASIAKILEARRRR